MDDIFRRRVWSLSTGKVLDDCETNAISDDKLNRDISKADDIRVAITLENALKLFERKGPTSSRYSRNRNCARRLRVAVVEAPLLGQDSAWTSPWTTQPRASHGI